MKLPVLWLCLAAAVGLNAAPTSDVRVPILVYHRVCDGKPGNTTVTPDHFRSQLQTLHDAGYHVIPLADLVAWKAGKGPAPAAHSVVITFDDGHESFYSEAKPIIDEFKIPVTQFLVTGCISNGTYCVNWDEVGKLTQDPLIDLESHTVTHPTFTKEARRRRAASYQRFVDVQLISSKATLEKRTNRSVPMLAWPYGIYSPMLLKRAANDGYKVGFSVECRSATRSDSNMAIPRCMVVNSDVGENLIRFLAWADEAATATPVNKKWRAMPIMAEPAPAPAKPIPTSTQ